MDSKNSKFKRLAELRANRALKDIRLIGNLSNKNYYAYNIEDVELIFSALRKEMKIAENRFKGSEKGRIKL